MMALLAALETIHGRPDESLPGLSHWAGSRSTSDGQLLPNHLWSYNSLPCGQWPRAELSPEMALPQFSIQFHHHLVPLSQLVQYALISTLLV